MRDENLKINQKNTNLPIYRFTLHITNLGTHFSIVFGFKKNSVCT